jgi:hypothetical protein
MNATLVLLRELLPVLGFELEEPDEEGFFWANHKVRPSMLVWESHGGIMFGAPFGPQNLKSPAACYSLANKINIKLTVVRAYFDEELHLSFDGWMPEGTGKEGIGLFLDSFARDVSEGMVQVVAAARGK